MICLQYMISSDLIFSMDIRISFFLNSCCSSQQSLQYRSDKNPLQHPTQHTNSALNAAHCIQTGHCTIHNAHNTHNTLHLAPCILHLAPCTLHLAPCTLHTAHCTLHLAHCTLHTAHCTSLPQLDKQPQSAHGSWKERRSHHQQQPCLSGQDLILLLDMGLKKEKKI